MTANLRVALVDDDPDLRLSIAQMLRLEGYEVLAFPSAEAALEAIGTDFAGPVVTDVRMPGMGGIALFHRLREIDPELPVLVMTAHADVEMAVNALKAGAWDFLTKPFDPVALRAAIARAASHRTLALDNRRLRALAEEAAEGSPLIGRSPAIVRLREMIDVLADADIDILIEGETGTGKELLARAIHAAGKRRRGRFVRLACSALPDLMLETELFSPSGSIASAQGGTLFLDDLDEASPALQARLAQLAETRLLTGRGEPMALNCRMIATAGEGEGSTPGRIAPALFYRLAGMRLRVPPLRERRDDVPLLFARFLSDAAARFNLPVPNISPSIRDHLLTDPWLGNVHQLASYADQVVMGFAPASLGPEGADTLPERVAAFERGAIIDALRAAGGDVGRAIEALGLPRKTFYYKVNRHNIPLADLRRGGAV